MLLKKMIAVCACAAAALSAAAGTLSPRAGLWENALECRAEKRPKDAAAALGEIAAQCAAENAWSEYALAVEMRADAEAAPAGGNAPIERVRALSAALADAPSDAARIFLEARLARAFAALADAPRPGTLRGNGDAERGNEAPEDIAAWSDAQLRAEAERRFENVLAQDELLKKIPFAAVAPKPVFADESARERFAEKFGKIAGAENFAAGIFSLNDATPAEFPTLYDFIARDAEKFFLERAAAEYPRLVRERKALPENIAFFADARTFADSVPAESADGNALLRALQILRSRTLFHAADADKSALARVGLDRLASAFSFIGNPTREQEDACEAALKKFIADFAYFPISAEASALLADFLVAQEREPEAFDVADKAVAAFGNAKNAAACKNILERLKQETVSSENVPEVWLASAPTRFSVSAKNAERLRLRAVPADWRDYLKKEHNRPTSLSAKEIRDLLDAENAVELTFPLKNFHDFRAHDHVVEIPAGKLAPGFYFLFFALNDHPFGGEESAGSCKFAWVGDVAAIRDAQPCAEADGTLRLRAVDAVTGAPLEGARVSAWNKARWGGERVAVPEIRTDALGEAVLSGLKRGRDPVVLVECERPDASAPGGNAVHAVSLERVLFSAPEQARERRTISLFSDRAVYRPGQKISFKGILAEPRKSDGAAQVFPGKKVEVKLRPAAYGDDRVLASAEAWTNGFGSFAGTLAVPASVGLGRCVIEAECEGFENAERVPVFIEEYRRPKAELKISLGEEPQILGGLARATVAGKAFSGEPLAGAKVRWSVSGGFGGELLAHGEGALDDAGTLKISWKTERAKLDEKFAETLPPAERRAEELRRRGSTKIAPWDGLKHMALAVDALHGVGHRKRQNAARKRLIGRHCVDEPVHVVGLHAGARRIVNEHPVGSPKLGRAKSVSDGFSALAPTLAKHHDLFRKILRHLFDPRILRTHHDINAGDAVDRGERFNRAREHRTAAERHVLLRTVEPHSGADARRADEGEDGGFGRLHGEDFRMNEPRGQPYPIRTTAAKCERPHANESGAAFGNETETQLRFGLVHA